MDSYNEANPPVLTARFTQFRKAPRDSNHFRDGTGGQPLIVQCTDCDFLGGAGGYNLLMGFTNCFFNRSGMGNSTGNRYPYEIYRNCTFYGGSLGFGHWEGTVPYWYSCFRDCAFDGTTFAIDDPFGVNTSYADYNYNAFLTGAAQPPTEGANTIPVDTAFNWQPGPLGNFYLPANSLLIDHGSDTAYHIFGLSSATTQVSESPDLGPVDIGYHYPFVLLGINGRYFSDSDLMVYYKLDDGAGATAKDSANGYNADLKSAPGIALPSWGEENLSLNGSQWADAALGSLADLDHQDCTILAWINETNTNKWGSGIIDKSYFDGGSGWGFWVNSGNHLEMVGSKSGGLVALTDASTGTFPFNQWCQVAVVWNDSESTASFYINGITNDNLNGNYFQYMHVTPSTTLADLQLGNLSDNFEDGGGNFYRFIGSLEHVALYKKALSYSDIQTEFLQTEPSTNVYYPSLLYYPIGNADYQRYRTMKLAQNPPPTSILMTFADNSLHGGTTGSFIMDDDDWTSNPGGITQSAIHFHGDGTYMETSDNSDFNFGSGPFTINFWLSPCNPGEVVLANADASDAFGWVVMLNSSYQIVLEPNGSDANEITSNGKANAPDTCTSPRWTMVTLVRDSPTHVNIYLNGILDKSQNTFAGVINQSPDPLMIGSSDYDGDLWGIQIWNQALTATDVANLFLNQVNGNNWP